MKMRIRLIVIILLGCIRQACAADQTPWQQEFNPVNGKGRTVVVITGDSGPASYSYYASDLAAQGYYAVLVNGTDFFGKGLSRNNIGLDRLKAVIARAQQSPHAIPGKVAVIGFSLGGGACLTYAARMPDTISAVVTYYPETIFISDPSNFASKIIVPTLIFAGVLDTYKDCCLIERARKLAGAGANIRLVEYRDAGHAFAIKRFPKSWRENDAADAFRKTLDYLKQNSA